MNVYSLVLDGLVLIIGGFIIRRAYVNGFVRSIVLFVGFFAAAALAIWLSRELSGYLYATFFRDTIANGVASLVSENGGTVNLSELVPRLLESLPVILVNPLLAAMGGEAEMTRQLTEAASGAMGSFGEIAADTIIGPIAISFIRIITCLLIFTICVIIVKIVASVFKIVRAVPIIGAADAWLGALIGLLQAILVLYVLMLFCSVVISASGDQLGWLNSDIIDSTYLFKLFYGFHP